MRRLLPLSAVLALALFAGCGGSDKSTSPASLNSRLLSASQMPGFKVSRTFEWDNPTDLFVQGLFTSETTKPSEFIRALENDGFDAGAGEQLQRGGNQGPQGLVDVLKFKSDKGAHKALDLIHNETLKQPCYSACSENPGEIEVAGIPGAKASQQVPLKNPPKGAGPPFVGYAVEFPIRSFLYVINAGGAPGSIKKSLVADAAKAYYDHVTKSSPTGGKY
jgi:hypothetical protein